MSEIGLDEFEFEEIPFPRIEFEEIPFSGFAVEDWSLVELLPSRKEWTTISLGLLLSLAFLLPESLLL
ncbi:unnamed protein product [Sphagnum tenellum]